MRKFVILPLFLVFLNSFSQKVKYCFPTSKNLSDTSLTLLVNSSTAKAFLKRDAGTYQRITRLELANLTDTVLFNKVMTASFALPSVEKLNLNNCNLEYTVPDFSRFPRLIHLKISKTSNYDKDDVCAALKDNIHLQHLELCCDMENDVPDSLHFLKNLSSLTLCSANPKPSTGPVIKSVYTYETGKDKYNSIYVSELGFEKNPNAPTGKKNSDLAYTNKYITPPVKGMNINDTVFELNPKKETILEYSSGTRIIIPEKSFVTSNGKRYDGPVKLFYREYRNPVDIMLSGIPMTGVENGETNYFQSAGMYEVWAYDNKNEKLQLAENKNLSIDFKTTTDSGSYNFYNLDTTTGVWTTKAENINIRDSLRAEFTELTPAMTEFITKRRDYSTVRPDLTKYNDRFYSRDYLGLVNTRNLDFNKDSSKYTIRSEGRKKIRPNYTVRFFKSTEDGELYFKFSDRRRRNFIDYYSTLSADMLQNCVLKYNGPAMSKSEFKKMVQKKKFMDYRLEKEGTQLTLKLKHRSGYVELPLNIVRLELHKDDKNPEYYVKKIHEKIAYSRHKTNLRSKSKRLDRKNKKGNNWNEYDYITEYNMHEATKLAYAKAAALFSEEEKGYSMKSFVKKAGMLELAYFGQRSRYTNNAGLNNMITKTNAVLLQSGLGFNNLDNYIHNGLLKEVYVQYTAPEGNKVKTDFVTTIIPGINTSINNPDDGEGHIPVKYISGKRSLFLRIDENGYMQVNSSKEVNMKDRSLAFSLNNSVYIKDKSSREIATLIGIK